MTELAFPPAPPAPGLAEPAAHVAPVAARRSPVVLTAGLILLLLTAIQGFVIRPDVERPGFQGLDDRWESSVGGADSGFPHAVAMVYNVLGGPLGALALLALTLGLMVTRRWWTACYAFVSFMGANMAVAQGLKHLVDRPRPPHPLVTVDHGSFPSGHVVTAAATLILLGTLFIPLAYRRFWWAFTVVATLGMMWSRTYLHAHWLSDTAAGALAGSGAALLAWWAFGPLVLREREQRRERKARA